MDDEVVDRALQSIDEEELVQLLRGLIDINSPTGEEAECAQYFGEFLSASGMSVQIQDIAPGRSNAVGTLRGGGGGYSLIFFGHLDTTLAGRQEEDYPIAGTLAPGFRAQSYVQDGCVWGLGSYNMKGGLACAGAAAAAVIRSGIELRGDVIVAGLAGESEKSLVDGLYKQFRGPRYEGSGFGARHLLHHGVVADYAIEPEPSDAYVVNARTGYVRAKVVVNGSMGYQGDLGSEGPTAGAIDWAITVVDAIKRWAPVYTKEHTYDTGLGLITPYVTVGAIESGAPYFPAKRPAVCNLYVEIRTAPHQSGTGAIAEFEEVLRAVCEENPSITYGLEVYAAKLPGTVTEASSSVIRTVLAARERVLGMPQESYPPAVAVASSDANYFRQHGVPVATCGPGSAPRGGERQLIDQLVQVTEIYVRSIADICGRPRAS